MVATCEYFGGCLSVCLSVCSAVLQSTDSLWTFNVNISIGGSDVGPRGVVGFFVTSGPDFRSPGDGSPAEDSGVELRLGSGTKAPRSKI